MIKKYTNFNDETLTRYFKDIKKSTPLSIKDEVSLAKRIQAGDGKACHELIEANLKFVVTIAKEYQFAGSNINDLISDGNEGLITAALKFDETKGFRFISYAVWWIRQSIMRGLNCESRLIRLPVNVVSGLKGIKNEVEKFSNHNGYEPSKSDLPDINVNDLIYLDTHESLSTIINSSDDDLTYLLKYNPEDNDTEEEHKREVAIRGKIEVMLDKLSERERDIVICYFGLNYLYDNMTLDSIGEKYDLTKERIRQIKAKTIRKLRHNAGELFMLLNPPIN